MNTAWIGDFERAAIARNPSLTAKLQAGLSEARVKRALGRAKVIGDVAPLIALYTWRNGTDLSISVPVNTKQGLEAERAKMTFFPEKPYYYFLCLEMAIGHFGHLEVAAKTHPRLTEGVGRYFPMFWDGSTDWLALDVKPPNKNRVMLMEHKSEQPFREAYSSFDEFVSDAIRTNAENKPLRCFQKLQTK
jgi:hypothetical protein